MTIQEYKEIIEGLERLQKMLQNTEKCKYDCRDCAFGVITDNYDVKTCGIEAVEDAVFWTCIEENR